MAEPIHCRISGPFPYLWLGFVILFTVAGVPLLLLDTIRGGPDSPGPVFATIWIGILLWFWYVALVWVSYEIRLSASGEIEFKSVLRKVKRNARALISIESAMAGLDPYTVVFKFAEGTSRTLRQMEGFSTLITKLRELNPEAKMRGV